MIDNIKRINLYLQIYLNNSDIDMKHDVFWQQNKRLDVFDSIKVIADLETDECFVLVNGICKRHETNVTLDDYEKILVDAEMSAKQLN